MCGRTGALIDGTSDGVHERQSCELQRRVLTSDCKRPLSNVVSLSDHNLKVLLIRPDLTQRRHDEAVSYYTHSHMHKCILSTYCNLPRSSTQCHCKGPQQQQSTFQLYKTGVLTVRTDGAESRITGCTVSSTDSDKHW